MTNQHGRSTHTHDHSGHGHDHHSHAPQVGENNERVVLVGFALTASFMVAEFIGGILSGSLALVADAGHMLTDAAALALAWAAFRFGRKLSDSKRTFGYMRLEVLAGFVNAITLFALVAWITYEAIQRLFAPHPVLAGPMFLVAVLGLVVNIAVFFMLRQGDTDHVNIRGALLHVLGDLLGSVAAIVAAVVIYLTGWTPIDPILSVLLSAVILRAAWALLRNAVQILMEGTPGNIEIDALRKHILDTVPDIEDVSHVHVWSITSGKPAATMEVSLKTGADYRTVSERVKKTLAQRYAIGHATVEIDWANHPRDCPLSEHAHGH
jgi:cobalt-zinc-cadmium efflux system protein|tara:strand:+ start:28950 stop:29918 length:969 start_codon:yes stop_codon:yes gene_type:complete